MLYSHDVDMLSLSPSLMWWCVCCLFLRSCSANNSLLQSSSKCQVMTLPNGFGDLQLTITASFGISHVYLLYTERHTRTHATHTHTRDERHTHTRHVIITQLLLRKSHIIQLWINTNGNILWRTTCPINKSNEVVDTVVRCEFELPSMQIPTRIQLSISTTFLQRSISVINYLSTSNRILF